MVLDANVCLTSKAGYLRREECPLSVPLADIEDICVGTPFGHGTQHRLWRLELGFPKGHRMLKERFLIGTMLSAVVWGSVHATPLDASLVVAQAPPQSEQERQEAAAAAAGPATKAARGAAAGGTQGRTRCAAAGPSARTSGAAATHTG